MNIIPGERGTIRSWPIEQFSYEKATLDGKVAFDPTDGLVEQLQDGLNSNVETAASFFACTISLGLGGHPTIFACLLGRLSTTTSNGTCETTCILVSSPIP